MGAKTASAMPPAPALRTHSSWYSDWQGPRASSDATQAAAAFQAGGSGALSVARSKVVRDGMPLSRRRGHAMAGGRCDAAHDGQAVNQDTHSAPSQVQGATVVNARRRLTALFAYVRL